MRKYFRLVLSIVTCELVGGVSALFTFAAIPTWYAYLNKPYFSPPNWVFGPVWTALYFLMGIAAFLVWQKGLQKTKVKRALGFFLLQLFLNFIWSVLFFGFRSPILGLIDIVTLLIFIILTLLLFYKTSKAAAIIFIPYLLWVSFATLLNLFIVLLNH